MDNIGSHIIIRFGICNSQKLVLSMCLLVTFHPLWQDFLATYSSSSTFSSLFSPSLYFIHLLIFLSPSFASSYFFFCPLRELPSCPSLPPPISSKISTSPLPPPPHSLYFLHFFLFLPTFLLIFLLILLLLLPSPFL